MLRDELKQRAKDLIEKYHQDNWAALYPAGQVNKWVYDAVAVNILNPLLNEIEMLNLQKSIEKTPY